MAERHQSNLMLKEAKDPDYINEVMETIIKMTQGSLSISDLKTQLEPWEQLESNADFITEASIEEVATDTQAEIKSDEVVVDESSVALTISTAAVMQQVYAHLADVRDLVMQLPNQSKLDAIGCVDDLAQELKLSLPPSELTRELPTKYKHLIRKAMDEHLRAQVSEEVSRQCSIILQAGKLVSSTAQPSGSVPLTP